MPGQFPVERLRLKLQTPESSVRWPSREDVLALSSLAHSDSQLRVICLQNLTTSGKVLAYSAHKNLCCVAMGMNLFSNPQPEPRFPTPVRCWVIVLLKARAPRVTVGTPPSLTGPEHMYLSQTPGPHKGLGFHVRPLEGSSDFSQFNA